MSEDCAEHIENLACTLTLIAMAWPAAWLLIGLGPTIGPLWRLVAYYCCIVPSLLLALGIVSSLFELMLEWVLGSNESDDESPDKPT